MREGDDVRLTRRTPPPPPDERDGRVMRPTWGGGGWLGGAACDGAPALVFLVPSSRARTSL